MRPPCFSTLGTSSRVSDCSRRSPLAQAFSVASLRSSGRTLRTSQHRSRAGTLLIEQIGAVQRHHLLHVLALRKDYFHRDAVALPHGLHHAIRFVGQPPGIDGEHAHFGGDARGQVDNHHAFLLEAGGNGEALPVRRDRPGQDFGRAGGFQTG